MTTLTVTAKGQVTLGKELLEHLGVEPGEKIELELLPEGRASIQAERKGNPIESLRFAETRRRKTAVAGGDR
jgi:bifunctional DNA-binding transcriptional regulator/antitoxin component of YhaV-PrlF toxin-antitoxin module